MRFYLFYVRTYCDGFVANMTDIRYQHGCDNRADALGAISHFYEGATWSAADGSYSDKIIGYALVPA